MPITISINSGKDFEPVSEGVHAAVIADVVDKGIQQTAFGPKPKVMFVYVTDEQDEEGRAKYVFESFTASLHEKASLRKRVKSLRAGKDIDSSEFDIETLLGTQVQAVIQHNEGKDGKVYANIASILKPNPKMFVAIPSDFTRKKDKEPKQGFTAKPVTRGRFEAAGSGLGAARAILAPASQPIGDEDIPF